MKWRASAIWWDCLTGVGTCVWVSIADILE